MKNATNFNTDLQALTCFNKSYQLLKDIQEIWVKCEKTNDVTSSRESGERRENSLKGHARQENRENESRSEINRREK